MIAFKSKSGVEGIENAIELVELAISELENVVFLNPSHEDELMGTIRNMHLLRYGMFELAVEFRKGM